MSKPLTETQIMLERIEEATRPGTKVMFRRRILAECADFIRRAATASPASGQTVALEEPSPSKALSTPPQPSAAWRGIEGWVLVPREPDEAMIAAGEKALQARRWARMREMMEKKGGFDNTPETIAQDGTEAYRAMINAAPTLALEDTGSSKGLGQINTSGTEAGE